MDPRVLEVMRDAGFSPHELNGGGAVWVAFSFLDEEPFSCPMM